MIFSPCKLLVKDKKIIGSEEKPESRETMQRNYDLMNMSLQESPSGKVPAGYASCPQHLL